MGEIPNCHLYPRTRKKQTVTLFSPVKSQRTTIPTALLKQYRAVKTNRRRHCCVLRERKFPKSRMEKCIIQGRPNKKFKFEIHFQEKTFYGVQHCCCHYFIYFFFEKLNDETDFKILICNEQNKRYSCLLICRVMIIFFIFKKKHYIEMKQGFLHFREVVSPPTKRNVTASRRILNRAANRRRHRNTNCNYDSVLLLFFIYFITYFVSF